MNFLFKPYPLQEQAWKKFLVSLSMGLFVFLFLFVFRPFGLSSISPDDVLLILAGYGVVCFIILLFDQFLIPSVFSFIFREDKWTVIKEILFMLFCIFTIGVGNMIYTTQVFSHYFGIQQFIYFQVVTLLVAILPVTINVLLKQLYLTRKNLKETKNISMRMHHKKRLDLNPDLQVTIHTENGKNCLTITALDILFICAADNYIELHYLEGGKEKQQLLRSTLKAAKDDLRNLNAFYRCHRGWIVNLDHVTSLTGNSQGYRLIINGSDIMVPVARNLNAELTARLAK